MRKIGLDLGSKTCGIAISDEKNNMALGLYNFHYTNNDMMQIISKLKSIISEYSNTIDIIVIGYPQNYKNPLLENTSSERVKKFCKLLDMHIPLKYDLIDENFTTIKANELLYNADLKASQRKKVIDMISAVVILQDYLDQQKHK